MLLLLNKLKEMTSDVQMILFPVLDILCLFLVCVSLLICPALI